jgi:hypothetical protein
MKEHVCPRCGNIFSDPADPAAHSHARIKVEEVDRALEPDAKSKSGGKAQKTATTRVETPASRSEAPSPAQRVPDITEVPPGEEGKWKVDKTTGKRLLSSISGLPILDPTSRDYVLHEAQRWTPWKIGPDGKLL